MMSRDRQIAVLASIVGLAGLIFGLVALSQDSGADDEWVRNRALPGDSAATSAAASASESDEREIRELSDRLERLEEPQIAEPQDATDDSSDGTTADRAAVLSERDDSDLSGTRVAAPEGNDLERVEPDTPTELDNNDQAGAWASQDEVLDKGQRLPDDTSAAQDGTLQSFSTDGVPAFVGHVKLGVSIPELKFVFPLSVWNTDLISLRALCNYFLEACQTFNEDPHNYNDLVTDTFSSSSLQITISDIWDDTTFETEAFSDKYLTYELHCPNVVKIFDENSDNFPSITIQKNNTYSSYAYSRSSPRLPWPEFPLQESLTLEPWEVEVGGGEYTLLSRPWLTSSQRDLVAMYETLYNEAMDDASWGRLGQMFFDLESNEKEYVWLGWKNYYYQVLPKWLEKYNYPLSSASGFYSQALINAAETVKNGIHYQVINSGAFEDAFWQYAHKASLVKGFEMWPPDDFSFWGKMRDMSDHVPVAIDSSSKVRIHDGISGEYHWALITARLSWRHDKEGGSSLGDPSFNVGKCEANISITLSYE